MSDGLTWNGKDDYLPDEALAAILTLVERLPATFDEGGVQAHAKSVTVTLRFPVVGPLAQYDALSDVLRASTVAGTLARNLRYERDRP